jgi:hypothetical protein
MHIAFSKESLWSPTSAFHDLGEVADGLREKASVQGCQSGCAAAKKELDVGKELWDAFGFG